MDTPTTHEKIVVLGEPSLAILNAINSEVELRKQELLHLLERYTLWVHLPSPETADHAMCQLVNIDTLSTQLRTLVNGAKVLKSAGRTALRRWANDILTTNHSHGGAPGNAHSIGARGGAQSILAFIDDENIRHSG